MITLVMDSLTFDEQSCFVLVHGLIKSDIEHLKQGQPLILDGESIGFPQIKVILCYGDDENEVRELLEDTYNFKIPDEVFNEKKNFGPQNGIDLMDEKHTKH